MSIDLRLLTALACGTPGPCIVGGTGGSGTRVTARVIRHGGVFIGTNLNVSEDALEFGDYSDRWIDTFMAHRTSPLSLAPQAEMVRELRVVLEKHLASLGTGARAWGWKEPRSAFLLPFFHSQFPMLKFLHVVRDGRDLAYSTNQNQLMKHGGTLLDSTETHWSQPLRSMTLWSRLNLLVANYAEQNLAGQYIVVRFEDLCAEPVRTIYRIFDFFSLQGDAEYVARLEVSPPESIGRWHTEDKKTLDELHRIGGNALQKFGYWMPR